jgi:hypothetical protein
MLEWYHVIFGANTIIETLSINRPFGGYFERIKPLSARKYPPTPETPLVQSWTCSNYIPSSVFSTTLERNTFASLINFGTRISSSHCTTHLQTDEVVAVLGRGLSSTSSYPHHPNYSTAHDHIKSGRVSVHPRRPSSINAITEWRRRQVPWLLGIGDQVQRQEARPKID